MKNSWKFARSPVLPLLVAVGVIVAVWHYTPKRLSIQERPKHHVENDTGPCPHYSSRFFEKRYPDAQVLSLVGSQIDIPEYNDCQRLLVNNSGGPSPAYTHLKFGYIAALFARADINNVYQMEAPIGNASTQPFYAALVHPHPATTRVTSIGLVWTTGPYAPLGLSAGFACIVLQWEGPVASSEPRNYYAWMVPVTYKQSCLSPLDLPASSAFYLGAQELPAQTNGDGSDEIPPVARWDWDARRGEQYVGIACPSGWCELYGENPQDPHGHFSSPGYHVPGGLKISGKAGRVVRQKGWYDEEYLSSTTTALGKPPELDAAGAIGTVVPVPELRERKMGSYKIGKFVPVAWVSINPFSPGYSAKYGFKLNAAPPQRPDVNALFLCRDDGTNKCKAQPKNNCLPTSDQTNGPRFYARLGATFDDPEATDFCVDYIATPGVMPGTVRWRWLEDDPTIWVSCPAGCCQISKPK